jgi:predicted ATPase
MGSSRRTNLPQAQTSFVGRVREHDELRRLLVLTRLLTLTGTGGGGKTRLALQTAEGLVDAYPDGVWLVELAALPPTDHDLLPVVRAVCEALGVREQPGEPPSATLAAFLAPRRLLLLIDNCEHLRAPCAALAATLLAACAHLQILATSREGLGVPGELLFAVPSLEVPPSGVAPEDVSRFAAAALFLTRAGLLPSRLTAASAAAVASICARLDGIPLAVELAAARTNMLTLELLAAQLDDCFRTLVAGPRTALPRQRTLRATLDWSYALLDADERTLLRRLSVFAGGWTIQAAESVCADGPSSSAVPAYFRLDRESVPALLGSLVSKSLVQIETAGDETRYRFLAPVLQYAAQALQTAESTIPLRDRHLTWLVRLVEEAEPHLTAHAQAAWLTRLEQNHDNLRAALAWARERADGEEEMRLAGALWRFWFMRGWFGEGRARLEEALKFVARCAPAARAKVLDGAGVLAYAQGDCERASALHLECLALRRRLGDRAGTAASLGNLGNVRRRQGDFAGAAALHEESLAIKRELGDKPGIAASLINLGVVAEQRGDGARAAALCEESLALKREVGDTWGVAAALNNLGSIASQLGDYPRAEKLHEESLALKRALGDKLGMIYSLNNLAGMARSQGDYERAAALFAESLLLSREMGARHETSFVLAGMARVISAQGRPLRAAVLAAAAESLRAAMSRPLTANERSEHEVLLADLRAAVGEAALARAWAEGRALSAERAVALALSSRAEEEGAPVCRAVMAAG